MVKKTCLAVLLTGIVLNPLRAMGQLSDTFDQFTDALSVGLFQGAAISSELILESIDDTDMIQGVNIISGFNFNGGVVQKTIIENDLSLLLESGDDVVQGINVFQGGAADEIAQTVTVDGTLAMSSRNSSNTIQGINIIYNK